MAAQRPRQSKLLRKIRRKQAQFRTSEPQMSVTFLDDDVLAESADEQPDHCPREQHPCTREYAYHLFIGNGGTRNGISRELLTAILGSVESLYMPESKDFSFTSVTGKRKAVNLLQHCNGICIQDTCKIRDLCHLISPLLLEGPPLHLYLSLVDSIPTSLLRYEVSGGPNLPPGLILIPDFISSTEETELLDYFSHSDCEEHYKEAHIMCTSEPSSPNSAIPQNSLLKPLVRDERHAEIDNTTETLENTAINFTLTPVEPINLSLSTHHSSLSSKNTPPPVVSALKHRRVSHYGYEFLYGNNTVDPDQPLPGGIPAVCMPLLERLKDQGLLKWLPDQLTVNDYLPGAGIPPHVDTHSPFEDGIVSLSLGSQVVMDFRHPDRRKVGVYLPRRSLLMMTGESRYLWSHGITPRKTDEVYCSLAGYDVIPSDHSLGDYQAHNNSSTILLRGRRLSLTFRRVKRSPCICGYPSRCDSQSDK